MPRKKKTPGITPEAVVAPAAEPPHGQPKLPTGNPTEDLLSLLQEPSGVELLDEAMRFGRDWLDAVTAIRARELSAERAKRRRAALRVYEPLETQKEFHASRAPTALIRGSNRSGKTLAAAVEVARAVTGQDPHKKYPERDGICFAVGKDLKHIGQVMWRKLARPGAIRVIKDGSGAWRAWRPWIPEDLARKAETRPSPPLIPARMIKEVAWENKKEQIPVLVRLTNGWEIHFFSSLGKPPQGSAIDLWWFDEEIVDPEWFPELSGRVLDRRGRGIWSATPQAGTDQLFELHEKAEKERLHKPKEERLVEEFVALLSDNPHIGEKEKQIFEEMLDDEGKRVRIGGDFALLGYKIYPQFNMSIHGIRDTMPDRNWCYYAYVDPGHSVCAVLFVAIPPPDLPSMNLLYDELYIPECNAWKFADAMKHKTEGICFQEFVMDRHMAIHTELGIGKTVMQQYSEELAKRGVKSVATVSSFRLASDNIEAGIMAVQGLLRIRDDGTPKLRVAYDRLPNFEYEIRRYHRKRVGGVITDKPDAKRSNHLMDNLRYMAMHDPRWIQPPHNRKSLTGARLYVKQKQDRKRKRNGESGGVNFGPGN